jgi:hypothetical protein
MKLPERKHDEGQNNIPFYSDLRLLDIPNLVLEEIVILILQS